jgi:hypothetical protein
MIDEDDLEIRKYLTTVMIALFWKVTLWSLVDGMGANVSMERTAFIFRVEQ